MKCAALLYAASLFVLSPLGGVAAEGAARVTPMTPDVVESYDAVRPSADFIKRVEMVPMRDGVKLYTVIFMKKGVKNAPILLSRTPYDAKGSTARAASQKLVNVLPAMDAPFVDDGYIRVYQDIRGLRHSEGQWIMNRPLAGPLNDTGIDESTDAYDTIDWLVKNVPQGNGKVGIIGSSYLGFTSLMAEINPHPALKAAAPQSPMVDGWRGDDWFHNGAFRLPSFDYALEMSEDKGDGSGIPHGAGDDYTLYLNAGSAGDFARAWGLDAVPFVQKLMQNPAYTPFWSLQAVDQLMAKRPLTVPTMLIVGQWDQEDSYGAPAMYKALADSKRRKAPLSLVIGPWRHSGVNHYGYELGALIFTGDTAAEFRTRWLKPFFDHYLKGAADPRIPAAISYATGANRWDESPRWPMGTPTPLYLTADFGTSFDKPAQAGHDDYVSDPAKPVPFIPRPIHMGDPMQWKPWLVQDQRFVSSRPDVLAYEGEPLGKAVHIMGAPAVELYAATSGSDSDWVVKLIDIYPDDIPEPVKEGSKPGVAGFELPVGIEIFRGRYVHGYATPQALAPGKVEHYRFELPNVDHVFLPGHRIGVQIQSSLFPLYDRNPQTYVSNIFDAGRGDYRAATQSVYRGGEQASRVWLPVVP
ncbi:CocE/NonD family hydrolase [Solimonas soli]|uniref:CocE/NonD family hydrolase n=1 Tax=Solimonas soli TaxID=413479 RepID=UPI000481BBD6|nr:CocE/NonD family hydrolase [Solimonas soli]